MNDSETTIYQKLITVIENMHVENINTMHLSILVIIFAAIYYLSCYLYDNAIYKKSPFKFNLAIGLFTVMTLLEGALYLFAGIDLFTLCAASGMWPVNLLVLILFIAFYITQLKTVSDIRMHFIFFNISDPFMVTLAPAFGAIVAIFHAFGYYTPIHWTMIVMGVLSLWQIIVTLIPTKGVSYVDKLLCLVYIITNSISKFLLAFTVSVYVGLILFQMAVNILLAILAPFLILFLLTFRFVMVPKD